MLIQEDVQGGEIMEIKRDCTARSIMTFHKTITSGGMKRGKRFGKVLKAE